MGQVVYDVEKSYVDRLAARKPRDLNFVLPHMNFSLTKKDFTGPFIDFFTVFNNIIFDSSKARS